MTNMSLKRFKCEVGIVGSGPVGLMLSTILNRYGVQHVILDRKMHAAEHPQAHFLHARTMEIIQSYMGGANKSILNSLPPSNCWRDFSYSHSLCGTELHRINHFLNTPKDFWLSTPSNVAHLAQNKVERIMRTHVDSTMQSSHSTYIRGYNATACNISKDGVIVTAQSCNRATEYSAIELECKYLIGADGSNSFIRRTLGINMEGEEAMQYLMNVHFTCPGLRKLLEPRPAMLYFVFNEAMVAVFVAHDATTDEWVCQIPYFPPFQSPEDFTESAVRKLLSATIASSTSQLNPSHRDLPVTINSINSWIMHAQVASRYGNIPQGAHQGRDVGNVFLVGDAAHRFPPSGGFGMNTGIQDAHNIAWKLALVTKGFAGPELLSHTYDQERRPTAQAITALSKFNYGLTAGLASALGVDPALATAAVAASDSTASRALLPFSVRRAAVLGALKTGLFTLKWLKDWRDNVLGSVRVRALRKLIDGGKSLPLIFPQADLDYRYNAGGVVRPAGSNTSTAAVIPENNAGRPYAGSLLHVGARVPHCWLAPAGDNTTAQQTLVVSTVQLPALLEGLAASSSRSGGSAFSQHVPRCIILVDREHADAVVSAVQSLGARCSELFCVVSIGAVRNGDPVADHAALQEAHQDPFYRVEGATYQSSAAARAESLAELDTLDARFLDAIVSHTGVSWDRREGEVRRLDLVDISGRWKAQVKSYHQHQANGATSTAPDDVRSLAVIVRPDGHVAHIVSTNAAASAEERVNVFVTAVSDVVKVLHFSV